MLDGTRSFNKVEVTVDELRAALARSREAHAVRRLTEYLDEFDGFDDPDEVDEAELRAGVLYDLQVADGDLHVRGGFNSKTAGVQLLVVFGDLVVDGAYEDYVDPQSFVLVTGSLRARDVVTAGWLEVHGSLTADRVIGDYNDCGACIGGDVRAGLFYGENHSFTIGGRLVCDVVVGWPQLKISSPPDTLALDDRRLLDHLDRELLRTYEDLDDAGERVLAVDGIRDFAAIKRRVRDGEPLKMS